MNAAVMRVGNMRLDAAQAYKVIHAVGWDAGNVHAARHGRTVWTAEDYNAAAQVSNRMFVQFGLAPAPRAKTMRANKRVRS